MTDTQKLMADVLHQHRLVTYASTTSDHKHRCQCGWVSSEPYCTWTDHPEHVAEQIVQRIGLKEGYDPARDCLVMWCDWCGDGLTRNPDVLTAAANAIDEGAQRCPDVIRSDNLFKLADSLRKLARRK